MYILIETLINIYIYIIINTFILECSQKDSRNRSITNLIYFYERYNIDGAPKNGLF